MEARDLIDALDLPPGVRVGQRVPKTLLVENGAPTATDKRRIQEGIDEIMWVAALKPDTIGVPAVKDDVREVVELAVLTLTLRPAAKAARLLELIHRAIPYPVLLVSTHLERVTLSLGLKRWSQGESGKAVLDGELVVVELGDGTSAEHVAPLCAALALARQPRQSLVTLYQGWMDAALAYQAARISGHFRLATSPEQIRSRQAALQELARLDIQAGALRAAAAKEKQAARLVELNLELRELEARRKEVRKRL
jgi:hypothetical protein